MAMDEATIKRLDALRQARRELGAIGVRIAAEAKARKDALKLDERSDLIDAEIIRLINESGQATAYFPNGDQLQRVVNTQVHVEDWPTFMEYVTETKNWQLVQQRAGKTTVIADVQARLDKLLGTLPGNEGATVLDYFKPENTRELPPLPTVPGVKIAPKYAVKDAPKRRSE